MEKTIKFEDLSVPHQRHVLSSIVGHALVLGTMWMAIRNLLHPEEWPVITLMASAVWLVLVLAFIREDIREAGSIKSFWIQQLGGYATESRIRVHPEAHAIRLSLGYVLLGRFLPYRQIHLEQMTSIEWNSGQASAMSGREMDDWHVSIWFKPSGKKPEALFPSCRKGGVFLVGPAGKKEEAEAFGTQLVNFLKQNGALLRPGERPHQFEHIGFQKTAGSDDASEP